MAYQNSQNYSGKKSDQTNAGQLKLYRLQTLRQPMPIPWTSMAGNGPILDFKCSSGKLCMHHSHISMFDAGQYLMAHTNGKKTDPDLGDILHTLIEK